MSIKILFWAGPASSNFLSSRNCQFPWNSSLPPQLSLYVFMLSLDSEKHRKLFMSFFSLRLFFRLGRPELKGGRIGRDWSFCPDWTSQPVTFTFFWGQVKVRQSSISWGTNPDPSIRRPSEAPARSESQLCLLQASDGWYWKWLSKWRRKGEELGITEVGSLSAQELQVGSYHSNYC